MTHTRRGFTFMALGLVVGLLASNLCIESTFAKKGGLQPRLQGTLTALIGTDRIATVALRGGAIRSIFIPVTAKVERNDFHTSLGAFKVGDFVEARFTADGSTVIKFEGVGP